MRAIVSQMKKLTTMRDDELMREAKELGAPLELIRQIAKTGKLPVPNFSAGGIATPADAALVRRLGAEAYSSDLAFSSPAIPRYARRPW